ADLTVRDGAVYVRTVSGLKRVDVLWRRLDGDFAAPLELNASSRLGGPGLVQALREGGVTVANGLGSGVVESRALMSFMPALARRILGEGLKLPNVATWWCGQARERGIVVDRLDSMAIAPAFGASFNGGAVRGGIGSELTAEERAALVSAIGARGMDFVGQEVVQLSTMPVWKDGALTPRPFVLRLYVAAVGDNDWTVMPGGFCRISDQADARFVSLQQGASAADVWVVSDRPVVETSLISPPDMVRIRRTIGTLPSRAADNLFWLARYLERTEATLRLVRALLGRLVDTGGTDDSPVIHVLLALLQANGALPETIDRGHASRLVAAVLTDRELPGALPQLVASARHARGAIRDRLAPDAFQVVTDLSDRIAALQGRRLSPAVAFDETNLALRQVAAFAGLASENMNRLMGWRFLELGRRIERAAWTGRMTGRIWREGASSALLDALLELGDSQITYRARYVAASSLLPVLDLMVLDDKNPRSVAFQTARIVDHLATLPATVVDGRPVPLLREALRLNGRLSTATVEDLTPDRLDHTVGELFALSETVTSRFFTDRPNRDLPEDME
ncbi:MAG TPA: circularly permuted type 2 ATP-grasp protein, partial [Methylomirabilota bacterium]|nr:circularly permuted type 2 ATP-grasp protein [Methylomirabilota bacterium]